MAVHRLVEPPGQGALPSVFRQYDLGSSNPGAATTPHSHRNQAGIRRGRQEEGWMSRGLWCGVLCRAHVLCGYTTISPSATTSHAHRAGSLCGGGKRVKASLASGSTTSFPVTPLCPRTWVISSRFPSTCRRMASMMRACVTRTLDPETARIAARLYVLTRPPHCPPGCTPAARPRVQPYSGWHAVGTDLEACNSSCTYASDHQYS